MTLVAARDLSVPAGLALLLRPRYTLCPSFRQESVKVAVWFSASQRLVQLAVVTMTLSVLVSCSSPAGRPALPPVAWQQQLALPSVQQAQQLEQQADSTAEQLTFDWLDQSRQRQVPALLFKPKRQNKAAPLLVFSHGLGGSRERYAYLGQYWASRGYYSLHVQHDGSDRKVWRGSRLLLPWRLMDAAGETEARARVADIRFALDQLLASDLAASIDRRHIIAAGHSYGANTTMLLAGAQVQQDGRLQSLQDRRISAAILISAPPFYNDQPLTEVPVLFPFNHDRFSRN